MSTSLDAVGTLADVPIVAQMTVNERNETIYGERVDQALGRIAAHDAVTATGLNCAVGPSSMLSSLELARAVTDKPISVQPNAGMPRSVEGRQLYMCTPEYMAEYAKRFFEKGARESSAVAVAPPPTTSGRLHGRFVRWAGPSLEPRAR